MTFYPAIKVVIITEKIILSEVCQMIESVGASGYTLTEASGKGSRNIRSSSNRASLVDDFANIKIDILFTDETKAHVLMNKVAEEFLNDYSGIIYCEHVEILRPNKFKSSI